MRKTITLFICVLLTISSLAQDTDPFNQEPSPKIGNTRLVLKYLGIEFTKEQRQLLNNTEIELIFEIDEEGHPILAETNGVANRSIQDSLYNKTPEIGLFNPRIVNGVPEASLYAIQLAYPTYGGTEQFLKLSKDLLFNQAEMEDIESYVEAGERLDLLVAGVMNQFLGNPSEHLGLGGGMKVDFGYAGKRNLIFGLNMSFYANGLQKEYPISSRREQFNAPPTLLLGFNFGKWFKRFSIQGEINYALQNITERTSENDPDWTQLRGWSPGLIINYPIRLGMQNPTYTYGTAALGENHLNLHLGIRRISLSLDEATGWMAEFGLGYRFTLKAVESYKLKEDFQNR